MAAPTLKLEYLASALSRASVAFAISSGFIRIEEALKEHADFGIHIVCAAEYVGVTDGFTGHARGEIGKHRQSGDFHPHMCRDNGLRNCGHPDSVRTDRSQVTNFSRCFIRGTRYSRVHAFTQIDSAIFAGFPKPLSQMLVVNIGLVDESRPPSILVRSAKRIYSKEVDVVRNEHQMSLRKIRIDRP